MNLSAVEKHRSSVPGYGSESGSTTYELETNDLTSLFCMKWTHDKHQACSPEPDAHRRYLLREHSDQLLLHKIQGLAVTIELWVL